MYSVDTPARLTAPTLRKLYAGIPRDITCTAPEQLTTMQKKDTILYTCGQTDTSEADKFIATNGMNAPLHTFTDCPDATTTFPNCRKPSSSAHAHAPHSSSPMHRRYPRTYVPSTS